MEVLWSLTIGEVVSELLYLLIQRSVQANVRPIVFDGVSMVAEKQGCAPEIARHFSGAAQFSHKVSLPQLPSSISGS